MAECFFKKDGSKTEFTKLDEDFVKVKLPDGSFSILGAKEEFALYYSLTPLKKD